MVAGGDLYDFHFAVVAAKLRSLHLKLPSSCNIFL